MQVIHVPAGSLVVMSGVPGSGKTTITARSNLPQGVVQSSDALRRQLGGEVKFIDTDGHLVVSPNETFGTIVWSTLEKTVEERLRQGLTTVVDATLVADEIPGTTDRAFFANIAKKHGVPFKVVIVDTPYDQVIAQNAKRASRVPVRVIDEFVNGVETRAQGKNPAKVVGAFQRDSRFPFEVAGPDAVLKIVSPLQLDCAEWDVVGDVHGMLDELKQLLEALGYVSDENGRYKHPQGRRLLFLGDIVDRGPKSLEALQFIKHLCDTGIAVCIKGNHDEKLCSFWDNAKAGTLESWKSFSNAQTGMELLRLPEDEGTRLVKFIREMPLFATYEDDQVRVVFGHADAKAFNLSTGRDELLHGSSNWGEFDSDAAMQRYLSTFDVFQHEGQPASKKQFYVRGHIPGTSWQPNVISLEAHAFQKGSLLALKLEQFIAGKSAVVPLPTTYDFNKVQAERIAPYVAMQKLVTQKLAVASIQPNYGLRLFKYAKKVFYDHMWGEAEPLLRARGHVYDVAGNLVSNPFDKVFNYREEGAGLDLKPDTPVKAVEKLNGFLGVISPHPVKKHDLLVHTTGSFTSDFVGYINDFITGPVRGAMLRLFNQRKLTLMFEVIHPQDPHIIPYTAEEHGLYLIGAREIREGSPLLTEEELDALALELGLRRPEHFDTTFGELLKLMETCRHEGYMARLLDESQTMVLKLKSVFYLTTKFLGRMSSGRWKHLFANPSDFKRNVDEEFFPLVDTLKANHQLNTILEMDEQQKLALVRQLVL